MLTINNIKDLVNTINNEDTLIGYHSKLEGLRKLLPRGCTLEHHYTRNGHYIDTDLICGVIKICQLEKSDSDRNKILMVTHY